MRIDGFEFTLTFVIGAALGYWAFAHYKKTGKVF